MLKSRRSYSYNGFSDYQTSLMYERVEEMPEIGELRDSFIHECAESGFLPEACAGDFANRLRYFLEEYTVSRIADSYFVEIIKEHIALICWREIAEEMLSR